MPPTMFDSHRTRSIIYFLFVLLVTCVTEAKERYSILIVQSNMMIPRIVDKTWQIDFSGVKKIMLSDAILYFSSAGKTINAEKWFAKFERLFNSKGIDAEEYDSLHRTVANNVGLVIVLANLSDVVAHSFMWRHWNSYVLRILNGEKIGFVDCVESRDETVEYKMVTVRNELAKLKGMGVNVTIALTRKSSDLVAHIRSRALVDLILESDGGIWTKHGWKRMGGSRSLAAMLLTVNEDGHVEELTTNKYDLIPDSGRRKRLENESEAPSTDTNQTLPSSRSDEIFVASDVLASQCNVDRDCAFGNLIADAIAYYARWRLSSPSYQWSKYPIAFYHTDYSNIELRRGYMSLSTFVNAFASIDEHLCLLRRRGRRIENILSKFGGSFNMPMMQIAGMYVWMGDDRPNLLTSRCSTGCNDYSLSEMDDRDVYCLIGPQGALNKIRRIRLFWGKKKCKVLSSTVLDALRVYASDKRDIFPQAEWRYWSTTGRMLKANRSGFNTKQLCLLGLCMSFGVVLLPFILSIFVLLGGL